MSAQPRRGVRRAFAAFCWLGVAAVLWIGVGDALRTFVFPPDDAYFERVMNGKLAGLEKTGGRALRCEAGERTRKGYEVKCQYFEGDQGEEFTYHWFALNGDYIGTLNGG